MANSYKSNISVYFLYIFDNKTILVNDLLLVRGPRASIKSRRFKKHRSIPLLKHLHKKKIHTLACLIV